MAGFPGRAPPRTPSPAPEGPPPWVVGRGRDAWRATPSAARAGMHRHPGDLSAVAPDPDPRGRAHEIAAHVAEITVHVGLADELDRYVGPGEGPGLGEARQRREVARAEEEVRPALLQQVVHEEIPVAHVPGDPAVDQP